MSKQRKRGFSDKEDLDKRDKSSRFSSLYPQHTLKEHLQDAQPKDTGAMDSQRMHLLSNRSRGNNYQLSRTDQSVSMSQLSPAKQQLRLPNQVYLEKMSSLDVSIREEVCEDPEDDERQPGQHGQPDQENRVQMQFAKLKSIVQGDAKQKGSPPRVSEDEDIDFFYEEQKEMFESMELPERITEYRAKSRRGKLVNATKLIVVTGFLISLGIVELALSLAHGSFLKRAGTVLHNNCVLQSDIAYAFTSSLMAASTMQHKWAYKGNAAITRHRHLEDAAGESLDRAQGARAHDERHRESGHPRVPGVL